MLVGRKAPTHAVLVGFATNRLDPRAPQSSRQSGHICVLCDNSLPRGTQRIGHRAVIEQGGIGKREWGLIQRHLPLDEALCLLSRLKSSDFVWYANSLELGFLPSSAYPW